MNISADLYYQMTAAWTALWLFIDSPLVAMWFFEGLNDRYRIRAPYTLTQPAFIWWRAVIERSATCIFMVGMGFFQMSFAPTSPHAPNNIYRTGGALILGLVFAVGAILERVTRNQVRSGLERQRVNIASEALRRFVRSLPNALRLQVIKLGYPIGSDELDIPGK